MGPKGSRMYGSEEEDQWDGGDRQTNQKQIFVERKQPAHPRDESNSASITDDGVPGQIEKDGENEVAVSKKGGNDS